MTTWEFRTARRRRVFMRLVGPVIRRLYDPLACEVVLRAGLAVVGARRLRGRHSRRAEGSVTAHVGVS